MPCCPVPRTMDGSVTVTLDAHSPSESSLSGISVEWSLILMNLEGNVAEGDPRECCSRLGCVSAKPLCSPTRAADVPRDANDRVRRIGTVGAGCISSVDIARASSSSSTSSAASIWIETSDDCVWSRRSPGIRIPDVSNSSAISAPQRGVA
jgi:hypothetical protein